MYTITQPKVCKFIRRLRTPTSHWHKNAIALSSPTFLYSVHLFVPTDHSILKVSTTNRHAYEPLRQSQAHSPPTYGATSDHQCPISNCRSRSHSDVFTLRARDFISSTWLSKASIFRQENRQSHYRNDPVKYDLNTKEVGHQYSPFVGNAAVPQKGPMPAWFEYYVVGKDSLFMVQKKIVW